MENLDWEIKHKVVFSHQTKGLDEKEDFVLTAIKKKKFRFIITSIRFNIGPFGNSFSLKETLIGLRIRKVGVVGTGKISNKRRVECPRCKEIQSLIMEYQSCKKCNKSFYLFDDK
jgi:hypothetical protein